MGQKVELIKVASSTGSGLVLQSAVSVERKIVLEQGAEAQILILNHAPKEKEALIANSVVLGRNARLKLLCVNLGGKETRTETSILHRGEGSRCEHFEVALLDGNEKLHARSSHTHAAANTYSRTSSRYAACGSSVIDVQGEVLLARQAQGGDAHFAAKSLLLSRDAVVKITPMLHVWNSEVSAGHGAAAAPVSEDELFYLGTRGIPETEGKLMILLGFLSGPAVEGGMDGKLLSAAGKAIEKKARDAFAQKGGMDG